MYILYKKGICIWNFNLENNVFIKETNFDNSSIGYWRYIINNIEFYVPNFGSILLIDSTFKDLNVDMPILTNINTKYVSKTITKSLEDKDFRFKIMMKEFFDSDQESTINQRNEEKFKEIFKQDTFTNPTNKISGAIPPDDSIKSLIDKICKDSNNLENLIINHSHFLHNRMGTLLNKSERPEPPNGNTDFKLGELVGYMIDGINYEVVMIFTIDPNISMAKIVKVNKDNNKNILSTSFIDANYGSLIKLNDKLKQVYKPNVKMGDEDLIETYEINF
jgi:hypothetical protein